MTPVLSLIVALAPLQGSSRLDAAPPVEGPPGPPPAAARSAPWIAQPIGGPKTKPGGFDPIRRFKTYVTGELPGSDVVFKVVFDVTAPFSGVVTVAAVESGAFALDGIDFVPGTGNTEVVVGAPVGKITHYDVLSGATLADYVADTNSTAVSPVPFSWPSSILSTPTHVYYTENQFGFGSTPCHRIIRKPFAGGAEEVVYDGSVHGLVNFEGLEIVDGRLYFFVKDPGPPDKRALISIGLAGGLWDTMPFAMHVPGLTEAPGPGTDGSDELDFDPFSGLIFGTNIIDGEVVAWDPFAMTEVSSPGATHFIDGAQVAASAGGLSLLGLSVDGIRSTGEGKMVFAGKGGVIAAFDILGVLGDGADDGDIIPLFVGGPATIAFDDLTPLIAR